MSPRNKCNGIVQARFREYLFLYNRISYIYNFVIRSITGFGNGCFRSFLKEVGIYGIIEFVFTFNPEQLTLRGRKVAEKSGEFINARYQYP